MSRSDTWGPNLCRGKVRFPTRRAAREAERKSFKARKNGQWMDVYDCKHCGGAHLATRGEKR